MCVERDFWCVALKRKMQENEMTLGRDRSCRGGAFVIGEVAAAVHDAIFEELRAIARDLHVGAVIRLQREHIHAAQMLDEFSRSMAKVGRVSKREWMLTSRFKLKAECDGALVIVGVEDGVNHHAVTELERFVVEIGSDVAKALTLGAGAMHAMEVKDGFFRKCG